ncbi:hypothetical protein GGS20DRAFT_446673 [Poronia punctata]|nr:hypothetical protein GGS20DRAFT_446673 [Poronia punctata]
MASSDNCVNYPPPGYSVPDFPSLCWPPDRCTLFFVYDSWRFTLLWTLILFIGFHLSVAAIALFMQAGKPRPIWTYLVAIPVVYGIVAGVEAVVAGSIVGSV